MKKIKTPAVFALILLLSNCELFLGPDAEITPEGVLKSLWTDFNEIHANIDFRMSHNINFNSWDDVLTEYLKRLTPCGRNLFLTCSGMLRELKDPHVALFAPGGNIFVFEPGTEALWFRHNRITGYLHSHFSDNFFLYGNFRSEPRIGYLHITSFIDYNDPDNMDWVKKMDDIIDFFIENNIQAVIIDVRNNYGGIVSNVENIAARFVAAERPYMKVSTKNGPGRNDFSSPMIFRVMPFGKRYSGQVAVLTNEETTSAAEWFVMAMKSQSHVTHVGTPTAGAFSMRITRPMINGWYYSIAPQRVTDMTGRTYEGIGLSPDPDFIFTGNLQGGIPVSSDTDLQLERVLDEVIKWLDQ